MSRPRFAELDYQITSMGALSLRRRVLPGTETEVYEVKLDDDFLMSSLFTAGEVDLARKALAEAPERPLRVVVGGLGLGHTAAAVLDDARVNQLVVIEALAPVIWWHQEHLVPLGRRLSEDPRCRLVEGDFFDLALSGRLAEAGSQRQGHEEPAGRAEGTAETRQPDESGRPDGTQVDAIILDIDHSPRHLLHPRHARFYGPEGMAQIVRMLRPGGVFALWSNDPPDAEYLALLRGVMPQAEAHVVRFPDAHGRPKASNTVYLAPR